MTQRLRLGAAFVAVALSSVLALAEDQAAPPASTAPGAAPAATLACLNAGSRYAVGEFACIAACHGVRRLARCDQVSSSASWTYVSEACPSAMINPAWPSDWTELPAVAAMSPIPLVVDKSAPVPEAKVLAFASFSDDPALGN